MAVLLLFLLSFSLTIYIDRTPEFSLFILGVRTLFINYSTLLFGSQHKNRTFVPLFLFDLFISSSVLFFLVAQFLRLFFLVVLCPCLTITWTISAGLGLETKYTIFQLNRNFNPPFRCVCSILKCALHF